MNLNINILLIFRPNSELLIYDWTSHGDIEVVTEDIERIDFDRFSKYDTQLREWRLRNEWEWAALRIKYTNEKDNVLSYFNVARFDVPELVIEPYDAKKLREVWLSVSIFVYVE